MARRDSAAAGSVVEVSQAGASPRLGVGARLERRATKAPSVSWWWGQTRTQRANSAGNWAASASGSGGPSNSAMGRISDVFLIAAQQPEEHFFVFLQRERARRVHQSAAGAQHLVGGAQEALLLLREVLSVLRRPVGEHVLVFAHDAVARARCIDEDAVEKVGKVARQHGPWGLGQDVIGYPTALQIAHERGHALALGFISYQETAVLHARGNLGGLAARGSAQVEDALAGLGGQDLDG